MPLVIVKPLNVLPFLRIKQSKKTRKRSAVWHVGPWQYDGATGRHKVKLGRKLRWESSTRAQRAAVKVRRSRERAETKAEWDRWFAGDRDPATAPARTHTRTPGGALARSTRRDGSQSTPGRPPQSRPTQGQTAPSETGPVAVCTFCGTPLDGGVCPRCNAAAREHAAQQQIAPAGVCGARTADGGQCQRTGACPYHRPNARPAGRPGGRTRNGRTR